MLKNLLEGTAQQMIEFLILSIGFDCQVKGFAWND